VARAALKRLLESGLGAPGRALLAWRTRGQAEALLASRGLTAPGRVLAARLSDRVARGPFAGLHYPRRRGDIVHAAKLLGAYECELHDALERLVARAPSRVVNVGSGDGYYVAGLARRLPAADVWAVDPDPLAQRACRDTAARNAVDGRVRQVERLDATGLDRALRAALNAAPPAGAHHLVVVDCEGFEDELLDPSLAPALAYADILVETHDFARPGVTARLGERFAGTHAVERLEVAARAPDRYPELEGLPPAIAAGLLDEFRHHPQSWLCLTAKTRSS